MVLTYPGKPGIFLIFLLFSILLTVPLNAQEITSHSPINWNKNLYSPSEQNFDSFEFEPEKREKKSVSKAFFYSLLIPGMGESYVGKYGYTRLFLSLEVLGWSLFAANRINVVNREEDYQNFAIQHAAINRQGKGDQYWIDIGKYETIFQHNEQRRRERDLEGIYEENAINYWRWDSDANRLFYDKQRIETREIERNEVFIVGAIVLNHLVSAINALRLAKAYNKQIDQLSWNFNMDFSPSNQKFFFTFSKTF
jgi:hypothetical protein